MEVQLCPRHSYGTAPDECAFCDNERLRAEVEALRGLLARCLPVVEQDAQMMAAITRHAPLDAESQAVHDSTEYESEKLLREIPAALMAGRT